MNKNFILKALLILILVNTSINYAKAQYSPSGQILVKAPNIVSGCSRDTVFIEFTNKQGPNCPSPGNGGGNVLFEVDIPGGNTINYQAGSVNSFPSGASFVSYAAKKLTINIPVPSYGISIKTWFVINATCDVTKIAPLPTFNLKATYPAGYGVGPETFVSTRMNIGVAQLNATIGSPSWSNQVNAFNQNINNNDIVRNDGYGSIDKIKVNMIISDSLTGYFGNTDWIYTSSPNFTSAVSLPVISYPDGQITQLSNGTRYVSFTITGTTLDPRDGRFDNGDLIYINNTYLKMPSTCQPDMIQKIWYEPICADGGPVCTKADTIFKTFKITAGIPIVGSANSSVTPWDGCPNKSASFTFKNSGTPLAGRPEVSTAYDVALNVVFQGLLSVNNLVVGGSTIIPTEQNIPGAVRAINWKIKNQLTIDPDGPGKGLEDLDGDGFYDDMRPGDSINVSFNWAVPCDLACGKDMFYDMFANATYTDYCGKLNGVTTTPIYKFGFEQTAPIAQVTPLPDYGTMGGKALNTKTGRFGFNYRQFNINLSAASVKLRINYSNSMEIVEPIKFLGVNHVISDFTKIGNGRVIPNGTTQADTIGLNTFNFVDKDSALEYTLTPTEMLSLFDNVGDSLVYSMTHISCDSFQTTFAQNSWQLIFKMGTANCPSTGLPPCGFDLACNKSFAYQINEGCGIKPCYIVKDSLFRNAAIGTTNVNSTTPLITAPTNFYVGDTLTKRFTAQLSADYTLMEPIGTYGIDYDLRNYFSLSYNKKPGTALALQPLLFIENLSTVTVIDTTTGTTIAIAPLKYKHFRSYFGTGYGSVQSSNTPVILDNIGPTDPFYGTWGGLAGYYCNFNVFVVDGAACPYEDTRYRQDASTPIEFSMKNVADDRVTETYYLSYEAALAEAGYNFSPGYAKYKFILDEKWVVNPAYPHTNTGQFLFKDGTDRYANTTYNPPGTYMSACGLAQAVGTIFTKELNVANPGATYNSTCGLTVKNELFLRSATGDLFPGGEVRVPFKLDSISMDLPSEYHIVAGTTIYNYHQSGVLNAGSATNTGITNHILWTSTGTNGEFPRMDDMSGNNIVHSLQYNISNTGTDNNITDNYRVPVRFYVRDEFGNKSVRIDTINITEATGDITVSTIGGLVQLADAGTCNPPYMDILLANNTLYSAGAALINVQGTASTSVIGFKDMGTPLDPITSADTGTVSANRKFALLGAFAPAEQRIVRIFFNTTICEDSLKIYTNFGCNYPAGNDINFNSTTLDSAQLVFKAIEPKLLVGAITPRIEVKSLCDTVEVILEVSNVKDPNLFNISAGIKLPPNMKYVPNTMKVNTATSALTTEIYYLAPVSGSLTSAGTPGDSMVLNVSSQMPLAAGQFGSSYFYFPGCGLVGPSDAPSGISPLNRIRVKFKAEFVACPTTTTSQINFKFDATNYCGLHTSNDGVSNIIYIGESSAPNNYSCNTNQSKVIAVCAKPGESQAILDTLIIKNEGGFANSGPSSATDSLIITLPIDLSNFTLSNFVINGAAVPLSTNAQGKYILRTTVPAGIPVGGSFNLPVSYNINPIVANFCSLVPSPTCPQLAFFTEFKSVITLACTVKGLTCTSLGTLTRGQGMTPREITCCASLGNRVWLDEGAGGGVAKDGLQNGSEPGVSNVAVSLYQNGIDGLSGTSDDVLVAASITDAYGNYLFESLPPSSSAATQYNVRVTPPANYALTTQTNTTDDNLNTAPSTTGSDVNVLGVSYSIDLSAGENNLNIDAGLIFPTATAVNAIGDKVWFDLDGNGQQNGTEPGVAGITVTLYNTDGITIVASTTTDANGNYLFNNLPATTNYKIKFSAPGGTKLTSSTGTTASDVTTDSDADAITGFTATVNTGAAGTTQLGIDAGLINDTKGALGDYVWNDINNNGLQDAGEQGIPNVTMKLYGPGVNNAIGGGDDVLLSTTTTDAKGYYIFPNLDPSKYFVVATPIVGYTNSTANVGTDDTKDVDFTIGAAPYTTSYVSGLYTLLSTAGGVTRDMTVDLGIHSNTPSLGSLGDYVWNDVNKDGIQTAGEPGVPNVTVHLLNGSGTAVNNAATGLPYVLVTDSIGNYKFVDLAAGTYIVEFANIPTGYVFTSQDASGTGAPGSGSDGTNDSDAKSTNGRTSAISLGASQNITSVDGGITQGTPAGTASLGNRVWYDNGNDATGVIVPANNNNGLQDGGELGVINVKVELLTAAGATVNVPNTAIPYVVYTNALGEYLFTGLPAGDYTVRFSNFPSGFTSSAANSGSSDAIDADANFAGSSITSSTTATTGVYTLQSGEDNHTVDMGIVPPTTGNNNSIGNFVWSDLNNDGIQDAGELGVQGVSVTLYNSGSDGIAGTSDDVKVGVATTDNNGKYQFVALPDGNYNVTFTNLPAGYNYTPKDAIGSTPINGSDPSVLSGRTTNYALDPTSASSTGINEVTVDGGLVTTRAALGDYVWLDTNGDGVQDLTEKGISGVTVTLYASDGTTVLASTITDAFGKYYFGNLVSGSFVVGYSTAPSNLSYTIQNTPGDNGNNTNSDANPSTGKTAVVALASGETDLTIDAGLKPSFAASVGDYVWNDKNSNGLQNIGEPGVPGIIVTLYDATTNAVVGTAVTDGNGKYLIDKIPVAFTGTSYYIIFSNLPSSATYTSRTDNVAIVDISLGSDPNALTGRTSNFTLTPGQYLPNVDAGIIGVLVLPVQLQSFIVNQNNCAANINWLSGIEESFKKYEIEYSTDGNNFIKLIEVIGKGSNSSYQYKSETPISGKVYYRLKMIDINESSIYSAIQSVTINCGKKSLKVFPIPANTYVNLNIEGLVGTITAQLKNSNGQILKRQFVQNGINQINTTGLSTGTYFIAIKDSNGNTETRKINIVH